MEALKHGMRCECKNLECSSHHAARNFPTRLCDRASVRMVAVWGKPEKLPDYVKPVVFPKVMIPMCAPCAEWHERRLVEEA